MALPDFFVAGAPKAGTTALHAALARHPALFMSPVKEPKFFLTDGPPPDRGGPGDAKTYREHVWRRADYEALFDRRTAGALRGESTPFYLYNRDAQRADQGADPGRQADRRAARPGRAGALELDPPVVGRARPDRRLRPGLRARSSAVAAGWADFWHYTGLGRYGEQLEHLYSVFPRSRSWSSATVP